MAEKNDADALTSAMMDANAAAYDGLTFSVVTMHGTGGSPYRVDAVRDGSIQVIQSGLTKSQAAGFLRGLACGLGLGSGLDS